MENKTGKYFKYAIGEIILVVIGILIALSINNWNENRKTDNIRENYLQQILLDLEKDKIYYNNTISLLESYLEGYNNFKEIYDEPDMNVSKFILGIQKLAYTLLNIEFKTSTIKTLINTGDIKLLPLTLRNKLTTYSGTQKHVKTIANDNNASSGNIIREATMNGANLDLMTRIQNQKEFRKYLDIEKKLPELVLELEAFISWKEFGEIGTIKSFNNLIKEADVIIAIINKELEK